jgi:lysophospholipase L1-like esterase
VEAAPPQRRIRRRGPILAVSAVGGLLLAELALRLFGPVPRLGNPPGLYVADERCGFRLLRNFRGEQVCEGGPLPIRTNALGFRGDELAPDGLRLLLLGDSQAFGFGAREEDAFPVVLQELYRAAGVSAQVVNAAVPSQSTWGELGLLEAVFDEVRPDGVLLALYVGNDFRENLPERFGRVICCSGTIIAVAPGESEAWLSFKAAVLTRVRLVPVVYSWFADPPSFEPPAGDRRQAFCDRMAWDTGFGLEMLRVRWSEVAQQAFDSTCRALDALRAACAVRGVPLLLAILPGPCQYSDPYWDRLVTRCGLVVDDYARDRPNRALLAWAAAKNVPAVDLLPAFVARQREKPDVLLFTDVHFSTAGHRLAAKVLAEFLLAG